MCTRRFLLILIFILGVSDVARNEELRSYVESIKGDLPKPCQFASTEDQINQRPIESIFPPPIDMNPFAQRPNLNMPTFYDDIMYPYPEPPPCPLGNGQQFIDSDYLIYPQPNGPQDDGLNYEPQCDLLECTRSCKNFMQKDSAIGTCQDNSCYCKDLDDNVSPDLIPEDESSTDANTISPMEWTYNDQSDWHKSFPFCKEGIQSPRNLMSKDTRDLSSNIEFHNFDESVAFLALNNGNGVEFLLQSATHLTITLDSVLNTQDNKKKFTLSHIQLHWPYEEHSLDNMKSGVMEMQLYFFDASKFCHYDDAKGNAWSQGEFPNVMALSVIFGLNNQKTDLSHGLIDSLVDLLSNNKVGRSLPSKPYLAFISNKLNYEFNSYVGSHSQPPCSQGLLWLVNQSPKNNFYISVDQLSMLQDVKDSNGERIINNVRDIQK